MLIYGLIGYCSKQIEQLDTLSPYTCSLFSFLLGNLLDSRKLHSKQKQAYQLSSKTRKLIFA